MTTKVKITSDASSNGDVVLNGPCTCEGPILNAVIRPGESRELWITSSTMLSITERHPAIAPEPEDIERKGSGGAIISKCGDKGELWAHEFVAMCPGVDEDTARAWFQNAIEAACSVRAFRAATEGETP
jgi:hypothetical protein